MPKPLKIRLTIILILFGTTIIKAFIANNFIFYDDRKRIIKELGEDSLQRARFVKITWRIQKNRQNNQSITLAAEKDQQERGMLYATILKSYIS
jgi:hypothetical protein